jgi:hypothetical protein
MLPRLSRRFLAAAAVAAALGAAVAIAAAENVDPNNNNSQFAWGENVGWINAEPAGGSGVQVSGTKLTGYMWGENIGWINMHCENNATCGTVGFGVTNDGAGNLGGYAWGENVGWISFSCQNNPSTCASTGNYGVTINPVTGIFSGYAWGENIGWISFFDDSPVAYQVQTDDGDLVGGAVDNCPFDNNAGQANTDSAPIVTSGVAVNDNTVANGDPQGDACDPDDDNDGLLDVDEAAGCNASGPLQQLNADTDGDAVRDGAECALGSNPANAASKPAPPAAGTDLDGDTLSAAFEVTIGSNPALADTDGDLITDGFEYKGYNTSPLLVNTDGDTGPAAQPCNDGREASSVDGNTTVNSNDLLIVSQQFGQTTKVNIDINKNGIINSGDMLVVAGNFVTTSC